VATQELTYDLVLKTNQAAGEIKKMLASVNKEAEKEGKVAGQKFYKGLQEQISASKIDISKGLSVDTKKIIDIKNEINRGINEGIITKTQGLGLLKSLPTEIATAQDKLINFSKFYERIQEKIAGVKLDVSKGIVVDKSKIDKIASEIDDGLRKGFLTRKQSLGLLSSLPKEAKDSAKKVSDELFRELQNKIATTKLDILKGAKIDKGKIDEIKNIFNELFEDNNDLIEDRLKDNKNSKNMPTNNKELVKEYIKYGLILEREEELKIIGEELVEQMKKLKEQKLKINMIEEFPKNNKKEIEKLENLKLKLLKMNKDDKNYKELEKEIETKSINLKKNQELHGYYNENHIKATEFKENKKHYNVSNKQLDRLRKEYIKLLNKHIEEKKEVKIKLVRKEYDNMDKIKYIAFLYDKIVNKSELAKIDKDYINKTLKNKTYLNEDEYNYLALRISQNIVDEKIKSKSYFDWIPSINVGYFFSFSKATNNQIKQGVKYSFNDYRPDTIALILKTISDSNDINKFNEKDIANILKLQRIKDLMEGKTDKILLDNLKFDEKGLLYENYVKKSINFLFGYDKNKENKYLSRDEATKYILNTEYPRVVKKYYFKDKDIIRQTNGFVNYFYKCIRYFDKGISKYFTNYIKTEKIDKKDAIGILNELKMKKYLNNQDIIIAMKKLETK